MDNRDLTAEMPKDAASEKANPDALTNLISQASTSLGASAASNFVPAEQVVHPKKRKKEEKQERTTGLKAFDIFLYPFLTNFAVFGMSVAATYLTVKGKDKDATGKLKFGKFGEFMAQRGDWLKDKFKAVGMNDSSANMARMVFFSFADGSLMAPVVKLFEDKREKIGKGIDEALGTVPEDLSVYKEEPKQSWWSVLGGRLATVSIVVPIAYGLDKAKLNKKIFYEPGEKLGGWLESKPAIKKLFKNVDPKELSSIGVFEAFYTSVCTAGLYFSSRFLARKAEKKDNDLPILTEQTSEEISAPCVDETPKNQPKTKILTKELASYKNPDVALQAKTPSLM